MVRYLLPDEWHRQGRDCAWLRWYGEEGKRYNVASSAQALRPTFRAGYK
jgi:hypothetical protein